MYNVGDKVELKKDIIFDYGKVAGKGKKDIIHIIDHEGFWLQELDVYIEHGFEGEYLQLA